MSRTDIRRATATQQRSAVDFRLLAAVLGLGFVASPALTAIDGVAGDALNAGVTLFAVPVVLSRFAQNRRILLWVVVFVTAYLLSSVFSGSYAEQGFRNTIATLTAATALMVFVSYGRDIVAFRWWRHIASVMILAGLLLVLTSEQPKNISGGAFTYLLALLVAIRLSKGAMRPGILVFAFIAVTAVAAFLFDFRSLIGYTVVLILGYLGAAHLPKRLFWLLGIVGSTAVIAVTIWYFLSIRTSDLAVAVSQFVANATGRPATSGREWLWPNILSIVSTYDPWFGLGSGALPRDIMPTTLSSHSFYIQVYLQVGWIGLGVLTMVLLSVWGRLAASRTTVGYFGAGLFLMFVTHNSTEVLMLQVGLMASIPAWCAIGLALSTSSSTDMPELIEARARRARIAGYGAPREFHRRVRSV